MLQRPRSHYKFLDDHFHTILTNMGRADLIGLEGSFTSSGDKYYQYRQKWEDNNIPFFHGAAMYHLLELIYPREVRDTPDGWVHPYQWVIDNYRGGHNLSQYMEGLS